MRRALVPALALLLGPGLAHAWQPGGNPIGQGSRWEAVASGPDRIVVAWIVNESSDHAEVRMQSWRAAGDLAPGWPSEGILASDVPGHKLHLAVCEDGAGGAFVAWTSYSPNPSSVHVQHLSAAGTLWPGWPAQGLRLDTGSPVGWAEAAAYDGAGGLIVGLREYWSASDRRVRIKRIDAAGAPAGGWPAEGHVIPNADGVGLAVDGDWRLYVSTDAFDPVQRKVVGVRVQRLGVDAAPDPGWPEGGAIVDVTVTDPHLWSQMKLFPDGTGGVFASWWDAFECLRYCGPPLRSNTRIRGDGTLVDGWIPALKGHWCRPDGTGGMLLGLTSGGRPGVLRLDAGGAPMPGWAPGGNPAMTEIVDPRHVVVTDDGQGGAFVAWTDDRTGGYRVYASRLDAEGRPVAGWPATGSLVNEARGELTGDLQLVSLVGGVAIAVWEEQTPHGRFGYVTALRPGEPGPIADLRAVQIDVGFGVVQAWPNPARGAFTAIVELQYEGPARLDLVDATGRVRESQNFEFRRLGRGARGAVRFNQARMLPPGVYWIRVTQGLRRASKKVLVLK